MPWHESCHSSKKLYNSIEVITLENKFEKFKEFIKSHTDFSKSFIYPIIFAILTAVFSIFISLFSEIATLGYLSKWKIQPSFIVHSRLSFYNYGKTILVIIFGIFLISIRNIEIINLKSSKNKLIKMFLALFSLIIDTILFMIFILFTLSMSGFFSLLINLIILSPLTYVLISLITTFLLKAILYISKLSAPSSTTQSHIFKLNPKNFMLALCSFIVLVVMVIFITTAYILGQATANFTHTFSKFTKDNYDYAVLTTFNNDKILASRINRTDSNEYPYEITNTYIVTSIENLVFTQITILNPQ